MKTLLHRSERDVFGRQSPAPRSYSGRMSCILFAFLTAGVLCGCSPEMDAPPGSSERIVSLGPALTEGLYLLGAEEKLVGCTIYCRRPAAARRKEKVGDAIRINLEKIAALRPHLVLATSVTAPNAVEKMEKMGIEVVTFPVAESFKGICDQFKRLGRLADREAEAEEIVARAAERVEATGNRVKGLRKTKTTIQLGTNPLVVVGRGTFTSDLIDLAGGINTVEAEGYIRYSREQVLKDDPDVIIVVSMGAEGEDAKNRWRRYESLSAVGTDRVHVFDAEEITTPTPLVFADTLREIAGFLHPDEVRGER